MTVELLNSVLNRGMLSHAVQPPTTEHCYAQWREREDDSPMAPLGLLLEDNGQSLDVKEEETVALMSGEPTSLNHFKTSRAVRLKGNPVGTDNDKARSFYISSSYAMFNPLSFCPFYIYL